MMAAVVAGSWAMGSAQDHQNQKPSSFGAAQMLSERTPAVPGDAAEAGRLARAIAGRARNDFALIAIDGPGGSGKSTLAAEVAQHLGPPGRVVYGDDFYRPMPAQARLRLSPREGYDHYFDWQRLRDQVLIPLAAGAAARYERYDWRTGQFVAKDPCHVPRCGVVIVEGVYVARPELAEYYDLTVWVDTPRAICLRRLHDRGHDHGPGNWNDRWRAAEDHYIAATRPATRLNLTVRGC
jgi:uridine kinase